jgi:hypothetical protein
MSLTDIGLIILGIFLVLGVVALLLRQLASGRERAVRERFPNAKAIVSGALLYGQESLGVKQGRGNGTLVLTDSELYFERWLPRKEFHVPLSAIQSIETPTSFLGKTNFRKLLKVDFRNDAGQNDAIAWLVPDLEGTKQALESALNR